MERLLLRIRAHVEAAGLSRLSVPSSPTCSLSTKITLPYRSSSSWTVPMTLATVVATVAFPLAPLSISKMDLTALSRTLHILTLLNRIGVDLIHGIILSMLSVAQSISLKEMNCSSQKPFTTSVLSPLPLRQLAISEITRVESTPQIPARTLLQMSIKPVWPSATVRKLTKSTGLSRTPGVLTGATKATSRSRGV